MAATGTTNSVPADSQNTILVFGARAATLTTATNPTANFTVNGITFESATDASGTSFTIDGSNIDFRKRGASTDPSITQNSAKDHTISAGLSLSDPLNLNGNGAGLITLAGAWTGANNDITKSGSSSYLITKDATSAGKVTINGGTVALSGTGAVNLLELRGGVIATSGTFSRSLGTGSTNVNFGAGGGGFAAYGGDLTVSTNLGTWGTTSRSLQAGTSLILGSAIANGTVTLSAALNIGSSNRNITLVDNVNSSNDKSRITGVISGSGGLTIDGTGRIELAAANNYTGATTVSTGTTVNVQNDTGLGTTAGSTTVNSGGSLEVQGGISVGAEALNISGTGVGNGGALRNVSGDNSYAGAVTLGAASRINSDSGTLSLTSATAISGSGRTLTVGGAGNVSISGGVATGSGGLTKDGAGTLTLGGTSTYTGTTSVTGGTLLVNGTTAAASSVVVGDGSGTDTLGGTGTIRGATTIQSGGRITGGTAGGVGTLTISNDLTMSSGSTWLVDLVGASADQIIGIVNLNLSGVSLAFQTQTPSWNLGDSWTIAQFSGTRTGTFAGLANGDTFFAGGSGGQFRVNYNDSLGSITVTAVPEPPTLIALCLLITGLWVGQRRIRAVRKSPTTRDDSEAAADESDSEFRLTTL